MRKATRVMNSLYLSHTHLPHLSLSHTQASLSHAHTHPNTHQLPFFLSTECIRENRLNRGKGHEINIFGSLLTTFEVNYIFEVAVADAQIGFD